MQPSGAPSHSSGETEDPRVTVIIACRNESRHLARSLRSWTAQRYPIGRLEIIVADGMSDDGSADIARATLEASPHAWSVVPNARRTATAAFNTGLRRAGGEVVIIAGAHAEFPADYVQRAVATLRTTGADCVGGSIETHGETTMARAIAIALASPFGVGGVAFRTRSDRSGFVDTVPFGAYPRDVFDRIGEFDERFVRNQDDEFNFRLTQNGGRIWLDKDLRSRYYSRASLSALWRQYFSYGAFKFLILAKYRRLPSWRHYVPATFVVALAASLLFAATVRRPVVATTVLGPYSLAVVAAALHSAIRELRLAPLVACAFPVLHLAYGIGFLSAAARFLGRRSTDPAV